MSVLAGGRRRGRLAARGTTTAEAGKPDPPRGIWRPFFGFLFGAAVGSTNSNSTTGSSRPRPYGQPGRGLLMLRPGSLARLYLLVAVDLMSAVLDLPVVVNHWLLMFLAKIGIVVAVAGGLVRRAEWVRDPGAFYTLNRSPSPGGLWWFLDAAVMLPPQCRSSYGAISAS